MLCGLGLRETPLFRSLRGCLLLAGALGVLSAPGVAGACSPTQYRDSGRYVGGDLATQVAARADMIQIVTVAARHTVTRTFSRGEFYLQFGDMELPDGYPEYIDFFAFELRPVETLKGAEPVDPLFFEDSLRIGGYDQAEFPGRSREDASEGRAFNSVPEWLFDRPGHNGFAFHGASEDSGLGGGPCNPPYALEVGQTLVALRDSTGRLYPADGAFPLGIDVEFRNGQNQRSRFHINMQSLVPISGPDDPFVVRLKAALAAR